MESQTTFLPEYPVKTHPNTNTVTRVEWWIAMILCTAIMTAWILEHLAGNRPADAGNFAPVWLPLTAALIASAGIIRLKDHSKWLRLQQALRYTGLFLLVWAANGLPLDLLRLTPLIPLPIDWSGVMIKSFAFAAAIMFLRFTYIRRKTTVSHGTAWYGLAAFLLALPYPILRTIWAFGGSTGLLEPGAAGEGFLPWLASIPWLLAAILSLLLFSPPLWMPRRLLLTGAWFATGVVAMIGPAACWSLITKLVSGADLDLEGGIKFWIPCLFYGSWLLWAIAAFAATRSYQLRSDSLEIKK
jgi:hypothetical protein